MARSAGYLSLLVAVCFALGAFAVQRYGLVGGTVAGFAAGPLVVKLLGAWAVAVGGYALYRLTVAGIAARVASKRRQHDLRNVVRLVFVLATAIAVLGVVTEQWVGVLFSLGIVGVAVTFALQQPLFSFIGWVYIMLNRPYQVGDRVRIDGARGDVIDVDYLVTTLWEIDGDLVSSNQPSGRVVTMPNSVVLSTQVYNFSWQGFPHVWNELSIQVAYETDLELARRLMTEVADDYLGDSMASNIAEYRDLLAETAVELEVQDRPSVNIVQQESWVELRLRYLVHPRRGTRVRNTLYERILAAFNDHPDAVKFPVSRNR